ncbi:MAG TPA: tetratricopeptide repeat protein [Candidatus Limnocylindrales bacterium]|nr:tetratricopeptide repeat protein [Candidatus Limnocylindrales bacterium]
MTTPAIATPEPEALFEAGRFGEALDAWRTVAAADPDAVRPRTRVAACLLALGRYADALELLEPLAAAHPQQPFLRVRLAAARAGSGDLDGALDALDAAAAAGARLAMGVDTEPAFERLRSRARFVAIRGRIDRNGRATADDPAFRAFDFWVGDWEARTEDGVLQGRNRIEVVLGGAAIVERWTGAAGYTGMSLNRLDRHTGRWRQTWVDDQGDVTEFVDGVADDGRVAFRAVAADGSWRRLTFFDEGPDAFRQLSEGSDDEGASWSIEYDFRYRRLTGAEDAT